MSTSGPSARWRARLMLSALAACCGLAVGTLSSTSRLPRSSDAVPVVPETAVPETTCVSAPPAWDPHLDWSAGPPC